MKTKFKDFLLYSMACIGAISLFLSVTNSQSTMDVNIVGVNGKTLNSWCSNDDCSIVEIVPTRDFNGKFNLYDVGRNQRRFIRSPKGS